MPLPEPVLGDERLRELLREDVPAGDLTTRSLGMGSHAATATFRARVPMTVCGVEEAVRLFELVGAQAQAQAGSGDRLPPCAPILQAYGRADALHMAWKVAQTLVEWASGIATAAARIVAAAAPVPVACTRKRVPGTQALSVKAVLAAGAHIHRLGLSETLLVFKEHRRYLAPGEAAPQAVVTRLHRLEPEKKVVVEVGDVDEATAWARAGADVLQLEKFSPAAVAHCVRTLQAIGFPGVVAAAGGVRAENAAAYAATGAGLLVTSAPYTAAPRDVQVDFS